MSLADYYDLLNLHDWYYPFSDKIDTYVKGHTNSKKLSELASLSPEHRDLYLAFDDHYFSGAAFGSAKINKPRRP